MGPDGVAWAFAASGRDADAEMTIKRSRFIGSVRTVLSADEAAEKIKEFPTLYPKSNHHCWAYRVGLSAPLEHCSDAGEPPGTAGRPILGAIKRHGLENTLIVVTRYFGGIKLGVRGLIEAYGNAAELAVSAAGVVQMELNDTLEVRCGYDFSKTLVTTLRKLGFGEDRQNTEYGADIDVRLDVPYSRRGSIAPVLEEMKERGFLTLLRWGNVQKICKKW